ncbi:hypothetical protein [Streptomyces niveus]|uniref:hypothetical protein n=1 Tax=Streptomyces niveus TaxID=193462 RepID=UPI003413F480
MSSTEIITIECPTCGAARRLPCRTLRNRPISALHRGRTTRYLNCRFALDLTEPHVRLIEKRIAHRVSSVGLRTTRSPHSQPWQLPIQELSDLINVSFLDLADVVTASAVGAQRTDLDDVLFGPDHIQHSMDALLYAMHDRQIRREMRVLVIGHDQVTNSLAEQQRALRHRLRKTERLLKEQRIAELTAAGVLPFPSETNDPERLARAWLGRYLSAEKEALVRSIAAADGLADSVTIHIRSIAEKITRSIANGWLAAPVNAAVEQVLTLDSQAFRRRLIADAGQHDGRDDALCHPLVLNRWRDELKVVLAEIAPLAENPTTKRLHDLPLVGSRRSTAQLEQLHSRRRLFSALLQRRDESVRLITTLNDALTLAEKSDPSYVRLKQSADQAYDELVRRHSGLYQYIRARLAPHETRQGRLLIQGSRTCLKQQIFAELDRMPSSNRRARPM